MSIRVQYAVSPEDLAAVSRSASAGAVKRENIMDSLRRLQQAQQFAAEQQLRREQMAQSGQENQADRQFRYGLSQLQAGADASQATQEFQNRQTLAKAQDQAAMDRLKASAGLDAGNAEHRANLDQRNWGLQHGPKFSPEMGTPQDPTAAVAAGQPPGPGAPPPTPSQRQDARLMQGIQNNEPWAIERGLQNGILQFQKGDKERAAQLQQQISQAGRDTRMSIPERNALQADLANELASIRPVMTPPQDRPQKPVDIATDNSVRLDPTTGKFYSMDDEAAPPNLPIFAPNPKTGKFEKLYDPADAKGTAKDTTPDPIKQRESFQKRFNEAHTLLEKEDADGNKIPPSPDEIEKYLKAQDELFQRLHPQPIEQSATKPNPFASAAPLNQGKADAGLMDQWTGQPGSAPPPSAKPNPFGKTQGGVTLLPNHRPGKDEGPVPIPNHNPNDKADVLPLKYKFDGHELPVEKHVPLQDGTKMPIVTAKINGHSVMTTPQGKALTIISKTPEGAYRTLAKMMTPTAGTFDDPIYAPDPATHEELSKVLPKGAWITDGKRRLKNE